VLLGREGSRRARFHVRLGGALNKTRESKDRFSQTDNNLVRILRVRKPLHGDLIRKSETDTAEVFAMFD
jgi:hypothetical protein